VLDKTTLIRYSINMMKDVEKITEVVLTVLEDFNYNQTSISSEAARLEIAKTIAAKLLNDAPVVQ
tara:strand:+ start:1320 stop:1514 length:195 start_codon:yes stop_codon:yes gene_type:complete